MAEERQSRCYAAIDGEYDGTNPLQHSMRALAIAVYEHPGAAPRPCVASIYRKLLPREGTSPSPETMREFWAKHPAQWAEVNANCVTPQQAMSDVAAFLGDIAARYAQVVFVAKPAAQDWMFFKCYYGLFAPPGSFDIGFRCVDIMPRIEQYCIDFGIANPKRLYMDLCQGMAYTHCALDDAMCQGHAFVEFLRRLRRQ